MLFAQNGSEYRSKSNPLYWKNRPPDGAYWQQDVHYNISARIDEEKHIVEGLETLDYWNNSPDTLTYVYFHLFQNAFVKGSHLHELEKAKKQKPRLGRYEKQGLGTTVEELSADGEDVTTELDNTVMKIYLPKPLYPGGKVTFSMKFHTYFDNGGSTRRRMKMYDAWGFKHYNGVQWFPKICVYDRKFGWDTYQHLNKEFYGDFGSYEVALDFPSNYIVEATGELQNRKDVLPDELRAKLDIKNFADKKWNDTPSVIIPYAKDSRKLWRFKALNVHDFAFTADPSYRIGTTYWKGVECVALVQEPHASGWQNAADYVAKIIKTFSEDIGMYQYPKIVAADAADGMEYPMLTLDGGKEPGYRGLFTHEIAHNWFYGMVGSNETYRAALDEGFTQFLTAYGLTHIDGDTLVEELPESKFKRYFHEPELVKGRRAYYAYLYDALNREEMPLNTHSNDFHSALGHEGGYRAVYYKTATMLYNLQYTLGDSLFLAAMQHYFYQWRFAHPYFEDFRNSVIQFTHVDLNWFFDQWIETTKTIDYSVKNIRKINGADSFAVKFLRKGEMEMPIDFTVTAKNGTQYSYHIPNNWFSKKTDATTLPKWYGWDKLYETYTAQLHVPSGIKSVQIDTSNRLADKYLLDNYKTNGLPVSPKVFQFKLDGLQSAGWDRKHYRAYVRPDIWWNPVDGIKLGAHIEGDYFFSMHKLDATVWVNTHFFQDFDYRSYESEGWYERYPLLNYTLNYTSPLSRNLTKLQLQINSRLLDGLWYHRGGFNWLVNGNNTLSLYGLTMWRPIAYDRDYLIYTNEWSSAKARPNASVNAAWSHLYNYRGGNGVYTLSIRAPFTGNSANDFNYAFAQLEAINNNRWKKFDIRTRLFARYGVGTVLPYESLLFLAGANPEGMMDNQFTRSVGYVLNDWRTYSQTGMNHFQQGGGLNLRGYAGYLVADDVEGDILIGYKGRGGISGNIEVDIDNYIPLKPKFIKDILHADVYAFADAGLIQLSRRNEQYWDIIPTTVLSDIRVDAGVGVALTVKKLKGIEKWKPLTLRLDMPFFVNRPPYANPDYFAFRYMIGFNRAF